MSGLPKNEATARNITCEVTRFNLADLYRAIADEAALGGSFSRATGINEFGQVVGVLTLMLSLVFNTLLLRELMPA